MVSGATWRFCCRAMTHVWSEAAPNIPEECQAPPPDPGDADAACNAEKKYTIKPNLKSIKTKVILRSCFFSSSVCQKQAACVTRNRLALAPVGQLSGKWWRPGRYLFQTGLRSRCASPGKRSIQSPSSCRSQTSLMQKHTWKYQSQIIVICDWIATSQADDLWLSVSQYIMLRLRNVTCLSRRSVHKTAQGSQQVATSPTDLEVVCELCWDMRNSGHTDR